MDYDSVMLKKTPLFDGVSDADLEKLLGCLDARKRSYCRNEAILLAGEEARDVGVVLSGRVQVVQEDVTGSRAILAQLGEGALFAEAFACSSFKTLSVSVFSVSESVVMFLDCQKLMTACPGGCTFHNQLIQNMLRVLANKNVLLSRKMEHLSKRTTREKLLSYLSEQAVICRSREFVIPFNRQELADYLCVDRSAMSAELGRLRDEGLLEFERSRFLLRDSG